MIPSLFQFLRRKRGEWLCWRGAHDYMRRPLRWHRVNACLMSGTNAECRRCRHWGWVSWGA